MLKTFFRKNVFDFIKIKLENNLPKVLDNTGRAELKSRTREQLKIIWLNGVLFTFGLIRFITGSAYKPTDDVAIKYSISTISTVAPNGPNFDSELTPKVNCYKNVQFNDKKSLLGGFVNITLVLLGNALIPMRRRSVFCITDNTAIAVSPISNSMAIGYSTFLRNEEV